MTQSSINSGGEVVLYEAPDGEIRWMCAWSRTPSGSPRLRWPSFWARTFGHHQTHRERVSRARTRGQISMCKFCTYCRRRQNLPGRSLQPRRRYLGGLPRKIEERHPVPYLGESDIERPPAPWLHPQRKAPSTERARRDRTSGRPTGAHVGRERTRYRRGAGGAGSCPAVYASMEIAARIR